MTNGINRNPQDSTGQEWTRADAHEFGQHVRQGGWRLGLLVARNVEKKDTTNRKHVPIGTSSKVSAREFAELSGVGKNRVLRYLEAWGRASADGIVPDAATLDPGTELTLDVDDLPLWSTYYEAVNRATAQPPRLIPPTVEQITEAVKADPQLAEAVAEHITPTAAQVSKAMRSDPQVEQAARDEAWEMTREKVRAESTPPAIPAAADRPTDRTARDERSDIVALAAKVRTARIALDDAIEIANRVDGAAVSALTDSIRTRCDLLDATLNSESFDQQLTALLESEAER